MDEQQEQDDLEQPLASFEPGSTPAASITGRTRLAASLPAALQQLAAQAQSRQIVELAAPEATWFWVAPILVGAELVFLATGYRRFGIVTAMLAGAAAGVGAWTLELFTSGNLQKSAEFLVLYLGTIVVSGAVLAGLLGWIVVRAKDSTSGAVREVALTLSPAAGPPIRVAVDRRALARALALGCHTLRLAGDGKPLVAEGDDKTFVAMCLDPVLAVPPDPGAVRVATHERTGPPPRPR